MSTMLEIPKSWAVHEASSSPAEMEPTLGCGLARVRSGSRRDRSQSTDALRSAVRGGDRVEPQVHAGLAVGSDVPVLDQPLMEQLDLLLARGVGVGHPVDDGDLAAAVGERGLQRNTAEDQRRGDSGKQVLH